MREMLFAINRPIFERSRNLRRMRFIETTFKEQVHIKCYCTSVWRKLFIK